MTYHAINQSSTQIKHIKKIITRDASSRKNENLANQLQVSLFLRRDFSGQNKAKVYSSEWS